MSECTTMCLGKEPGHAHLTITRPRYIEYIVRAREPYMRRYEIIARTDSERHAYELLAELMRTTRRFKRGDILGDEGPESWYGPSVLMEMVR